MPIAKWATPGSRSANILSTVANSLANGSESSVVTYNNASSRDGTALLTLKLGSFTPSAGGWVGIRMTINDGTDTADRIGGDFFQIPLTATATAKIGIVPVRLHPFSLRFSILNNSGFALPASGNELYVTPYNEEVN